MSVASGHEVDDGNDLLRQREREVLRQRQVGLELLCLGGHVARSTNVTAFKVDHGVEVFLGRDVTWVLGARVHFLYVNHRKTTTLELFSK